MLLTQREQLLGAQGDVLAGRLLVQAELVAVVPAARRGRGAHVVWGCKSKRMSLVLSWIATPFKAGSPPNPSQVSHPGGRAQFCPMGLGDPGGGQPHIGSKGHGRLLKSSCSKFWLQEDAFGVGVREFGVMGSLCRGAGPLHNP